MVACCQQYGGAAIVSGYDPDLLLVEPDRFDERGVQVLREMGCIREPIRWRRSLLLALLFSLAGLYIGLMAVSAVSENQAQSDTPASEESMGEEEAPP